MWPIRTAAEVEGKKTLICTMAVCVINDDVEFAKRAWITAALISKVRPHVLNAFLGNRGLAALSLNCGTGWKWVVIFEPRVPRRKSLVPVE
jgi:hypothetical protein